ncbi:MAG: 3-deoxy-D-manno-octulosonic acid transferase [Flavobacteriaceae bacterium]|nr:3-deoxy-D-manno-octulosonic acid transferase [Flavobacteriaceae bacterium]
MLFLYTFLSFIAWQIVQIAAIWNPKLKKFVAGRKKSFAILEHSVDHNKKLLWIHAASLGEYEQGLPILRQLKLAYPKHQILMSLFSPSGYEAVKDSKEADIYVYLPWDSPSKVKRFLALARPQMAVFVKYEFWPHYLHQIYQQQIPCLLVSALFREKHIFFKWYGGFMRKHLRSFEQLFVQDLASKTLLSQIGVSNTTHAGDTRFDRVIERKIATKPLDFIQKFKGDKKLVVFGSSWPEDENWYTEWVKHQTAYRILIAPHQIKPKKIARLIQNLHPKKCIRYTQLDSNPNIEDFDVFILDTIGLLGAAYADADLAFIGGGVGDTGLHNTLEAAVYGIPIVIGPKYAHFKEAEDLVALGGIYSAKNAKDCGMQLEDILKNQKRYAEMQQINLDYIGQYAGATKKVVDYIKKKKLLS